MDEIVARRNKMERYIVSYSDSDSVTPQNREVVINATPLNMAIASPSLDLLVIILDN